MAKKTTSKKITSKTSKSSSPKTAIKKTVPTKKTQIKGVVKTKKQASKKNITLKTTKKPLAKKVAKPVSKKVVKKVQPKSVSKKSGATMKKVASKNKISSNKKSLSQQKQLRAAINAKAEPKKASTKKVVAKAPAKPVPKKVVQKKTTVQKKEVVTKKFAKPVPKKVEEKKQPKVKTVSKKEETKKVSKIVEVKTEIQEKHVELPEVSAQRHKGKFRVRPSNNIYFSIEDLNAYFEKRTTFNSTQHIEKNVNKVKKAIPQSVAKPAVIPVVPRPPLAVATVFDILGLNPVVAKTHEKLDEQDVPRKWKKYYKLLVDLRKHHSSGVEMRAEEVMKRSAKDDAGDLSSYGQHLADAGSESFERDIAYNLISNQKEILAEIDEAIKRIKNGTYGICEVTGKPIPESRLLSIPYTRCTKEGQEIKEAEIKRQKANQRMSLYDMSDGTSTPSHSDEESAS